VASFDNQSHPGSSEHPSGSSPLVRIIHYAVVAALVVGGLVYWMMKPPSLNPMADSRSAEAMALVQTHRAQDAPTLRQAIDAHVRSLETQGKGVRSGEWRVEQESPETYRVSIIVREEGSRTWFEREYLWRVHVPKRAVEAITLPAAELMPMNSGNGLVSPGERSRATDRPLEVRPG
jgi:hypothetical protein